MTLVSILLQIILVAGMWRPIQNGLEDAVLYDLEVILTALYRTDPLKLEGYDGLETGPSIMQFLCRNMDKVRRITSELNELDLSWMNLKRLPVQGILQMANLKKLTLGHNRGLRIFQDDIEVISCLPIEEVSICDSDISFETFKAIQELPRLTRLDISCNRSLNKYPGVSKFGELATRLVELDVARCNLEGDWLDDILGCTNLKCLNVSGCPYLFDEGVPSAGFSHMRSLDSLDVSFCKLNSDWMDVILECTSLVDLDISYNDIINMSHTNLSKFKNLKSLKRLKAIQCNLTTASLSEMCKCGGLEELSVSSNRRLWVDGDEVDFGTCRESLRVLRANFTELDERGLRVLCGLPKTVSYGNPICKTMEEYGFPNLAILDIDWNRILGPVISQECFSFGRLEETLVELNVSGIDITSSNAIKAICRCEGLLKLNASFNSDLWSGASDTLDFGCLKSRLQVLNVRDTKLPPVILSKIFEFDQLVELKMHYNDRSCEGLGINEVEVGGVRNTLRKIGMNKTGLTGEGLKWIFREFKELEEVDVRYNELITSADLMSLDFDMLRNRLKMFFIPADDETATDLQKRLPMTMVYRYY